MRDSTIQANSIPTHDPPSHPSARIQAILFDWAGTTIDYGSRAPAVVFQEIFRRSRVEITMAEAREPMGRAKRDHLEAITRMPRVCAAWQVVHGRPPDTSDVDRMYTDFLPLQLETLRSGSEVIPGVVETVAECRRQGLKIGSTTGYTRALMEVVVPIARRGGYAPDTVVCADDVRSGRPAPWLNFRAAEHLGVYPMSGIVVVDDTPVGIQAGRNAGMWCVAVARTGNALGLPRAEAEGLSTEEWNSRRQAIQTEFHRAGAHFVIDGVADLPSVLAQLPVG